MNWQYKEVDKSLAYRIGELLQSLMVIRDSLHGLKEQRPHQVIPLSGQLRALLTERSGQADPLLRSIAELLGQDLRVYAMSGHEVDDLPTDVRPVLHIKGFPLSLQQELPAQREIQIEELLQREIILIGEKKYTVEDVITWYANKAGGAHFSRKMPDDFVRLLSLPILGQGPLTSIVQQIGEATLRMGQQLIKRLVDFEIHFLLAIPKIPETSVAVILDANYPNSDMHLCLRIQPLGKLEFIVVGLQGESITISCSRMLNWTSVHHIRVRLAIGDELATELEITFDGNVVASSHVPVPIFVASDIRNYDVFLNRARDGQVQRFQFGLVEMAMFGAEHGPLEHSRLNVYFEQRRHEIDLPCAVFDHESWGHAPAGTNDQQMSGRVLKRNVWGFLGVEPQS